MTLVRNMRPRISVVSVLSLQLLLVLAATGCEGKAASKESAAPPSAPSAAPIATGPTGVAEAPPKLKPGAKNIGILVFDQVFITEFSAPYDVYHHVSGDKINVFLVAPTMDPVTTYEHVTIKPHYSFANAPHIDVLVVPSGNNSKTTDRTNTAFIDYVKKTAGAADMVTSHCWGAFTLGQAGVLDGKDATTFPTSTGDLAQMFPNIKVASDRRYVQAGNVMTSNGGLAAYESALAVVEKLFGAEEADKVAKGLVFAPQNVTYSRNPTLAVAERTPQ